MFSRSFNFRIKSWEQKEKKKQKKKNNNRQLVFSDMVN